MAYFMFISTKYVTFSIIWFDICFCHLVIGENYFSAEAAAVLEELTQGKLLQAQVVGRAEDGIPYVHIYQISGNMSLSL